jgi:hypothetical protein
MARKWRRLIIAHNNKMRLKIYYSPHSLVHLDARSGREKGRQDKTGCRKGALVNLNPLYSTAGRKAK